jgi:hypothetical protein
MPPLRIVWAVTRAGADAFAACPTTDGGAARNRLIDGGAGGATAVDTTVASE